MNSKRAKAIRARVYGDMAMGQTQYIRQPGTNALIADRYRQMYQMEKGRKNELPKLVSRETKKELRGNRAKRRKANKYFSRFARRARS